MCIRVRYRGEVLDFSAANAQLPILRRDGTVGWLPWGLRRRDNHLRFPDGSGVTTYQLPQLTQQQLHPRPLRLPIDAIEMQDSGKRAVWLNLPPRHLLRGVLVSWQSEARAYLLMEEAKGWQTHWRTLWPILMIPQADGCSYHCTVLYPDLAQFHPYYAAARPLPEDRPCST